jgi:hypothetical protein
MQIEKRILEDSVEYGYYQDGVFILHREDGPAEECARYRIWYFHGEHHREGGPAVEYSGGDKFWYLHGKLHREDGPAIDWVNNPKEYWIDGERVDGRRIKSLAKAYKISKVCK